MRHLILSVTLFLATTQSFAQEKSTPVILGKVEMSKTGQKITGAGRVEALENVAVAPQLSGKLVRKVSVKEGDWISVGDVVVELDDTEAVKALAKAKAAYASAQASHENAAIAIERKRELKKQGVASKEEFDTVTMTFNTSAAALEQAKLDVETASQDLEKYRIVSPKKGRVLSVNIREGELSAAANTIDLAVDGSLIVKAEIPETKIRDLAPGAPADVIPLDGVTEKGTVHSIDIKIDPDSRLGTVKVALRPDTTLISGMFARVSVEGSAHDKISLPVKAITFLNGKSVVFQVNKENRLAAHKISIISIEDDTAFVSGDVNENDLVVTSGPGLLNEGNLVHIVPVKETSQ